jgi:hypothetical protein
VHLITLREILRDADVAHAISAVVGECSLSEEQTEQALIDLRIPRAANVARISFSLGL